MKQRVYETPETRIIDVDTAQVICMSSSETETETYTIVNNPDWF